MVDAVNAPVDNQAPRHPTRQRPLNHQEFRQASRALKAARERKEAAFVATAEGARKAMAGVDPALAQWTIEAALRQHPTAAEWWLALGQVHAHCERKVQAGAAWARAVECAGSDLMLLHRIGQQAIATGLDPVTLAATSSGPQDAAQRHKDVSATGDPADPEPLTAALLGNLPAVIDHLEAEVRRDGPTCPAAKHLAYFLDASGQGSRARCVRGRRLAALGRGPEAVAELSAAEPADREDDRFVCAYIRALRMAGQGDHLIRLAGRDLALPPAAQLELAEALLDLGREQWIDTQLAAVLRGPLDGAQILAWMLVQPAVASDPDALARGLRRFEPLLQALEALALPVDADRRSALVETIAPAFYLAYQGEVTEPLQHRYSRLVERWMASVATDWGLPPAAPRPVQGRRLRIGYATSFAGFHTVMRHFAGWLEHADRTSFETHLFPLASERDWMTDFLARQVDVAHPPATTTAEAARQIRAAGLDVLVYPEVGMDPLTFRLAALRLAPVQCAAWGHPVSTGFASIDHYISADAMEPANAPSLYRERLLRLPGIGACVPACRILGRPRTRAEFGFAPDEVICLSPQSLFKYHPDDDAIFARIAGALDHAVLVFAEGEYPAWTRTFGGRLRAAFAKAGVPFEGRVRFVPRQAFDDFLSLLQSADLFIDCLRWSGGMTSLDALAVGLPVITLPGSTMRSRQSAGMLTQMGLTETIASDPDDFVALVTRLGADAHLRQDLSRRILLARDQLFGDRRNVASLESFFRWAVQDAGASDVAGLTRDQAADAEPPAAAH